MGPQVLIGNPRTSWREWLKANRGKRDLLCLDPADPQQGIPGRLALFQGEHPVATRFFGSLDAQRAPHVVLTALAEMLPKLGSDGLVQLFPYRQSPLLRQVTALALQLVRPSAILIATGTELGDLGVDAERTEIQLEEALPFTVQHAQRKAQWLRLIEQCESHTIEMRSVVFDGARLGSGTPLSAEDRGRAGLGDACYAERCGANLLVVAGYEPEDGEIARALDITGCSRANFVDPGSYHDLLCAFVRADGEEIGMGLIQEIDWANGRAEILCTAVPPASVRVLRLGSIRIDRNGRELGELKAWQV